MEAVLPCDPNWEGVTNDEVADFLMEKFERSYSLSDLQELCADWAEELMKVCTKEELLKILKRFLDTNINSKLVLETYENELDIMKEEALELFM